LAVWRYLGLGIACFFSIYSTSSENTVRYYRRIYFNGIHDIIFKIEIRNNELPEKYLYKVTYDSNNRIISISFPVTSLPGLVSNSEISNIDISYMGNGQIWKYFRKGGLPAFGDYKEFYRVFDLNEDSFPISLTNFNYYDNFVEDSSGIAYYLFKTDSIGRITEILRKNKDGSHIADKKGKCCTRYVYGINALIVQESNYNINGVLANDSNGVAVIKLTVDNMGNITECRYYDHNLRPTKNKAQSYATCKMDYDHDGNVICGKLLDQNNQLVDTQNTLFPIIRMQYDSLGLPSAIDYYDKNEILRQCKTINAETGIIRECHYDSKGKIEADLDEGYTFYCEKFDDYGNLIEEYYTDANGNLTRLAKEGYAIIKKKYDNYNLVEFCFLNVDSSLVENSLTGHALEKRYYDSRGKIIRAEFYDENGRLVNLNSNGAATVQIEYDANGIPVVVKRFDKNGNRMY